MRYPSRLVVVVLRLSLCLALTAPVWGQEPSPPSAIYVSGGTGILSITVVGANAGTVTPLVADSTTYQGLVVGPDNNTTDNTTNPVHPYLLYACDPTNDTIIRFDPSDVAAGVDTVYHGGGLDPQCGRFTNTGDLIVTSSVAGSGIWAITSATSGQHLADVGLGAGVGSFKTVQVPLTGTGQLGAGIAQKNAGGLLTVDLSNKDVILTPYVLGGSFNGPTSVYVKASSSVIPAPFGLAKLSDGEIFVSSQSTGSKTSNTIAHFNSNGSGGKTCVDLGNKYMPFFMQMTADNTLYVATSASSGGVVYTLTYNGVTCAATPVATNGKLPSTLVGIALPPTSVTQGPVMLSSGQANLFNFGFAAFQFTLGSTASCKLSVTANQINQATVYTYTDPNPLDLFFGAAQAVDLGRDGFETAFDLNTDPPNSSCGDDNGELVSVYVDNLLVQNPRVVACDSATACDVVQSFGDYPKGSILPDDPIYTGRDSTSRHFLVNASLNSGTEFGQFCGFASPLPMTDSTGFAPGPPAGPFSNNLAVKFKLATQSGTCQNGPYITDATALVSVAQILSPKGKSVFVPIYVDSSGNSTSTLPPEPLTIKADSNQQYQLSLSLKNPLYVSGGTYQLTITFLTNNTIQQTVEFTVK